MPIIDIEFIGQTDLSNDTQLTQKLVNALGKVFKSPTGQTWVKIRFLPDAHYAENESTAQSKPVFVTVLMQHLPEINRRKRLAIAISEAVASVTQLPIKSVHLIFHPQGAERVAFGGELILD